MLYPLANSLQTIRIFLNLDLFWLFDLNDEYMAKLIWVVPFE